MTKTVNSVIPIATQDTKTEPIQPLPQPDVIIKIQLLILRTSLCALLEKT